MKRIIFSFLLAISSLASYAYTAYIDGIYYNLNSEAKTADVTYKDIRYNSYSGVVTIPETVTFEANFSMKPKTKARYNSECCLSQSIGRLLEKDLDI